MAPSCSRTFTMSMGWMIQVASMPEAPPLTNGLTAFQAVEGAGASDAMPLLSDGGRQQYAAGWAWYARGERRSGCVSG